MGRGMAALDFNGDGIKDLAVLQRNNSRFEDIGTYDYGRIFFLYGGTDFDTGQTLLSMALRMITSILAV